MNVIKKEGKTKRSHIKRKWNAVQAIMLKQRASFHIEHLLHLPVRDADEKNKKTMREHTRTCTHSVENSQLSHRNRTDINQSLVAAAAQFALSNHNCVHTQYSTSFSFHHNDKYKTQISIFGQKK